MNLPHFATKPSLSLVLAIGVSLALFTTQVVTAAAATLTVDPSPIWAGNIVVGQSTTLSSTLTNHGTQALTIKAASNSSAYSVTSPSFPLTLAAGKSVKVAIRFAPTSFQRATGSVTFSSSAATIALALNGWGVSGNLSASASSVNFGSVAAGSSRSVTETLTNSGSSSVTISSANTNGSAFARTGITPPVTLSPSQSLTFTIMFLPKSSGAATGSLTVVSNAKDSTLTIPLSGNAASGSTLSLSPTSANLGSVAVGTSKTMSATLSASGANVVVSSATTTSSEFTVSGMALPLTIPAGKSATITVKFAPNSSGTATGKLTFASNATNSPAVTTLTGDGTTTTQHDVALSWEPSSSQVSGYYVYRASKSGGPYSKINSSPDAGTSYGDTGVSAGQTYYYVVTGVSSAGKESGYSNQVAAVVP
jgi:hypothetical protein